jgi:hypothetical protein
VAEINGSEKGMGLNELKKLKTHNYRFAPILLLVLLTHLMPSTDAAATIFSFKNEPFGDSLKTVTKTDSLKEPDAAETKARALFAGVTYGNNSSFLGRYQTQVLPYYSADISYKTKAGLWFSCVAYGISGTATLVDEIDLLAGWNFNVSKRLDASLFYTRYFFTETTDLLKSSVQNTTSASLGLDWGLLYSKISSNYIFGGANDVFLVFDNSRYIEFPRVFNDKDYLSIEPKVSIIAGTQTFVESHMISQGTPVSVPIGGGPGGPRGRPSGGGSTYSTTAESSRTSFNILSYEVSLPLAYTTGRLSFEVSGRYCKPVNLLEGDNSVPQFFFTGGILYFMTSK